MNPSDTRVSAGVSALAIALCITGAWASLVAQSVKNLLGVQETWVQSLSREESLKEEMATHSSVLAWATLSGSIDSHGPPRSGHLAFL